MTETELRESPGSRAAPPLRDTLLFTLGVAGLFLVGGIPLQLLFGEAGLLLSQLLLLGVPPILFVLLSGYDPVRVFSLRWPTRRQVIGGLVFLAGGVQLAWFLAWAQSFVVPVPVEYLEAMAEALRPDGLRRYLWLLVLVAMVPAFAEEVLFRGVVLSGFREGLPPFWAILAVGLVFGLFHLSPQTAFRFLPTAWMGVLLAWLVVVTRSLPLTIVLHFANNAAILTLGAVPVIRDSVTDAEQTPPLVLLPIALGLFVWGAYLVMDQRSSPSPTPTNP